MSDNTTLNPGVNGDVARSIDRAGVKTQVVAIDLGGQRPAQGADAIRRAQTASGNRSNLQ